MIMPLNETTFNVEPVMNNASRIRITCAIVNLHPGRFKLYSALFSNDYCNAGKNFAKIRWHAEC
jgi:hypothetical protein